VDFSEAFRPLLVVTDPLISSWMEVSMPPILILSEDDARNLAVSKFMEMMMGRSKL
jgi:hypothetical protein